MNNSGRGAAPGRTDGWTERGGDIFIRIILQHRISSGKVAQCLLAWACTMLNLDFFGGGAKAEISSQLTGGSSLPS